MLKRCPRCGGKGNLYRWSEGVVGPLIGGIADVFREPERCPICGGRGYVSDVPIEFLQILWLEE